MDEHPGDRRRKQSVSRECCGLTSELENFLFLSGGGAAHSPVDPCPSRTTEGTVSRKKHRTTYTPFPEQVDGASAF